MNASWRRLRSDAAAYAVLRLVSGLLSFALFALIARWYAASEVKALYYFLFLAGFFTSGLRVFTTVAAGLAGHERRTEKLRRALAAYARVLCVAVLLLPLAGWVLAGPAVPAWALLAIVAVVLLAGVDADLLRALVGRSSLVAALAASGAVCALLCLAWVRSPGGAFLAVLLQWLPLCALQAWVAWRLRRGIRRALHRVWQVRGRGLAALLGVALFDGLVINAPFLLDLPVAPEVGVSVGVATRIFVSSILLLPLVLYWSNSGALGLLAQRLRTSPPRLYAALAWLSGLLAGSAFALCFGLLAGQAPSALELAAALSLLTGYAAYAAASRYGAGGAERSKPASRPAAVAAWAQRRRLLLPGLAALLAINALGLSWALGAAHPALCLALVQGAVMLAAAALLLALRTPRSAGPEQGAP